MLDKLYEQYGRMEIHKQLIKVKQRQVLEKIAKLEKKAKKLKGEKK